MTNTNSSSSITDVQDRHASVRHFTDQPVSDELLRTILNTARRSPTSSNWQTYSMIIVRDPATRKELARLAGNQAHIEQCQAFVGFCADIHRTGYATAMHGVEQAKGLEHFLVSSVDAALVGMSAMTALEAHGLGGVMIGGMRNHPKEAGALLGLPSGVYIVFGMSIGWPNPEKKLGELKPRLPEELVIHHERYDASDPTAKLAAYDETLGAFYDRTGSNKHAAAWSGPIANGLKSQRRPHLHDELIEMGFKLD